MNPDVQDENIQNIELEEPEYLNSLENNIISQSELTNKMEIEHESFTEKNILPKLSEKIFKSEKVSKKDIPEYDPRRFEDA